MRVHLNRLEAWEALEGREEVLRRAARLALDSADPPVRGEVSITCLEAPEIARLNRDYLGREGPTDVIAFRLDGDDELLGDVYLCPEVADRAAGEAGEGLLEEVVRLVIHGVLHVLGHDHPEDEGRWDSPMYRLQERLVREAAVPGRGS